MRLCILGTDERGMMLRKLAQEKGYLLTEVNPDAVVLPLPKGKYADLKRCYKKGQLFIAGMTDEAIEAEAKAQEWRMKRVMEDETFLMENAILTAEGAVYKAMCARKGALCRCRCLVAGYGRIGKALTGMLRGLGSDVTVAARREAARRAAGDNSVDMLQMADVAGKMDMVFNTVPSVIFTEEILKTMQKDVVLMELASAPYGMDMEAAVRQGLNVQIEGGLPGRYCPRDAAKAWMDFIERSVRE